MPKFREVSGQFVGYIPDSIDADIVPDRAPMDGRVKFTPVFTGGVIAFPELVPPEFAHPRTIHAKIVDGFVQVEVNEGEGDDEQIVLQPLSLMVTVDDEATQVWSWRAEFSEILIGASDEYVTIPSWSFRVPDGVGPVDLTELVPIKGSTGSALAKGPRGAGLQTITAQNGELVFGYTDGEQTTIPVPEAVQGPQGEPGPAGADGAEGPEGPQGPPGEIPDLLVGNISDATPTGKNLMLAATEGAARNALGLQTGATAINGSLSELNNGVSNSPRVWTPANIANYTEGKLSVLADHLEASKSFLSVTDFGAEGDGVADDHAAIQSGIEAVTGTGIELYFPAGKYRIESTIRATGDGLRIRLHKDAEIVRGFMSNMFVNGAHQSTTGGFGNISISGGTWNANGVEFPDWGSILCLAEASNIHVYDCTLKNVCKSHLLELSSVRNVLAENIEFSGYIDPTGTRAYAEAFQLERTSPTGFPEFNMSTNNPCVDITLRNIRQTDPDDGYEVWPVGFGGHYVDPVGVPTSTILVSDSDFGFCSRNVCRIQNWVNVSVVRVRGSAPLGLVAEGTLDFTHNLVVDSCTISATTGTGVQADRFRSVRVIGNKISGSTNGVTLRGSVDVEISGNKISTTSNDAVLIAQFSTTEQTRSVVVSGNNVSKARLAVNLNHGTEDVLVTGNRFHGLTNHGVALNQTSTGVLVEGNSFVLPTTNRVVNFVATSGTAGIGGNRYPASTVTFHNGTTDQAAVGANYPL